MKLTSTKKSKGFTLVETLVALAIFSITITALTQIYISTLRSERVAYALLNNENSARYAVELMSRDIRMGKDFPVDGDYDSLSFKTYYSGATSDVTYVLSNGQLTRNDIVITPSIITIKKISGESPFMVRNQIGLSQVFITTAFEAQITVNGQDYVFPVRTSVTPRFLNL